jgi:iron(III) transport system substrate-binding protein
LNIKEKAAPVEIAFLEPVLTQTGSVVWVAGNAPRPHAALLFVDFLLSQEAQQMIANFGRIAGRGDVQLKYGVGQRRLHFLSPDWVEKKFEEVNHLFDRILQRR